MSKAGPGHAAAELSEQGVSVLAPSCVLCYKGYLCNGGGWCQYSGWCQGVRVAQVPTLSLHRLHIAT